MNIEKIRSIAVAASLFTLAACDGDPPATDAGTDAGMMIQDGGDDAGGDDAGPALCGGAECDADEACVRDVCLATCGADLSGWDAALSADLAPVAVFCRGALAFGTRATGTTTDVFDITAATSSTGTTFTLSTWVASAGTSPTPTLIGTADAVHPSDASLFGGGYVAASPSGAYVAFGYTLGDASYTGEVFAILAADGTSTAIGADGNFDATWLDDQIVLVNGLMIEGATESGQALYSVDLSGAPVARQIVTGIGSSSGSVDIAGDSVLVGGLDDSFVGHVYAVSRAAIEAAAAGGAAVVVGSGDEVLVGGDPVPSAFDVVGTLLVTSRYDAGFALEALEAYPITAGPTLGAPSDLTTGATFTAVYAAAADGLVLRFAEGLLLVE